MSEHHPFPSDTDEMPRTPLRRRTAMAATAAFVAVAVVGGTAWALDRSAAPAADARPGSAGAALVTPGPDATPAPRAGAASPSPSAAPAAALATSSPAASETGPRSGSQTTSEPTSTTSGRPVTRTVPSTIPDGYRLPHEGMDADAPWTLVDLVDLSCGEDEVSFASSSDSRVLVQRGHEYADHEALLVYADVDDALAVMKDARSLEGCLPAADGRVSVTPLAGPWGEAVVVAVVAPEGGVGGSYWVLARTGTAIAVVGTTGDLLSAALPDPRVVDRLTEQIAPIAAELCAYTVAGC